MADLDGPLVFAETGSPYFCRNRAPGCVWVPQHWRFSSLKIVCSLPLPLPLPLPSPPWKFLDIHSWFTCRDWTQVPKNQDKPLFWSSRECLKRVQETNYSENYCGIKILKSMSDTPLTCDMEYTSPASCVWLCQHDGDELSLWIGVVGVRPHTQKKKKPCFMGGRRPSK